MMGQLGWFMYALLLLLLIFLAMLGIEHHLSTKALFHVTEKMLQKRGLLGKERRTNK